MNIRREKLQAWLRSELEKKGRGAKSALATHLGARADAITRILNVEPGKETRDISADELVKMIEFFGNTPFDVSPPTRERPRLVSSFDPDDPEIDEEQAGIAQDTWKPQIPNAIPEIDGKLGAGSGQVGEVINLPVGKNTVSGHKVVAEWLLPDDYLRNEAKVSPQKTLVMEIVGDSMQPTYQPGDRVLVDLSQNLMQSDTVYAISDGFSEPQIKRLQRVPFSNPPQVIIISDNPALQSFTVELDRLTIIGRICAVVARR